MLKIAIIEDQTDILSLILEMLSSEKDLKIVGTYYAGRNAIEDIPKVKPDIVIIDLGLPDISGIECIKILKKHHLKSEFMVWTVFDDVTNVFEALEAGASSYLLKTSSQQFIVDSIKDLSTGGSPMSPHIARLLLNKFFTLPKQNKIQNNLTDREYQILELLSKGFLYKEIASQLSISINTLKVHCYNIYQKLHVTNKIDAINKVYK